VNTPIRIAALALALAAPAAAQDRMLDLERKVDALQREVQALKTDRRAEAPEASMLSKGVTWGGYGEFVTQSFSRKRQNGARAGVKDRADLQRIVLYAGYHFNDWIRFASELEVEHAGSGEAAETRGEIALEQAYVDFLLVRDAGWLDSLNARAGLLLVPMGIINETHEPPTFHGVLRPNVERVIIPATWRENGAGFVAKAGPVTAKGYALAGLTALTNANPTVDGFNGGGAIRGGRTAGTNSFAEDAAWVSAANVAIPGGSIGGSLYLGEADQKLTAASVPVTLWETHGQAEYRGAELRALYAQGRVGNPDVVNAANAVAPLANGGIGRKFFGGYVEAAYDVLSAFGSPKGHYLAPFFRFERYDTQQDVPNGWTNDPANSRTDYTAGLTYKPIRQVALKTDYQWKRNQAKTGVNQWNLGLGFMF